MSIWTHVIGCIRVDGIPDLGARIHTIEKILGPICTFDNWNDASILPRGSEGGLQYRIIEYHTGLPWIVIPVWGDLRDFDDVEKLREWWADILLKLRWIRDAVLRVQVEGREPMIWGNISAEDSDSEEAKDGPKGD